MFEGVVRSNLAAGAAADSTDEDDDNISLTSTIPDVHDPETQFVVDDVLAEMPPSAGTRGETCYLIKWEGFDLKDCTWEPEENLGPELKAMWEEKKERCAAGLETPFNIEEFYRAQQRATDEKAERHRRRNAKRRRKGLPLTHPIDYEPSDEELEAFYEESTKKSDTKDGPSKAASASGKTTPRKADETEKRSEPRRQSISKATTGDKDMAAKKSPATSSTSARNLADRQPSTGYQGTARRLSTTSTGVDNVAGKSKTAVPSQGASSSPTGKTGGIRNSALRAKKTVQKKVLTANTNIFSGGKTRNPRTNLQQAMSDPSKGKKMFSNLRQRRLAEKRGRDLEDLPIALETVIPVNGRVLSRANSNEVASPSPITRTPSMELKSAIAPREDAPAKKKRKSVRWVEDENQTLVEEPEQMDIDPPGTTVSGHPRLKSPPPPPKDNNDSPRKLSLDQGHTRVLLQSLDKKVVVGGSAVLTATFDGVPRDPVQDWISRFVAQDKIEFRYTCFAKSIKSRLGELVPSQSNDGTSNATFNGTVASTENDSELESIAQYLRAGLLGLYYTESQWSIIVYPTKCDEWKDVWTGQEPPSPSGAALRYTVFFTNKDFQHFFRPPNALLRPAEISEAVSGRRLLMGRLLKINYDKLLPKYSKLPAAHGFFLAFPQTRQASMLSIYHWLRDCNPHCSIYSSLQAGAWNAFWEKIKERHFRGAVIVHEALVQSLFRFPGLAQHLTRGYEEYWCFSESAQAQPITQSIIPTAGPGKPGNIRFSRLFPARNVICVTPSFLVSEPQRAYEFFAWFLEKTQGGHYYRLVTAWNIHEYLRDLAHEKFQDWEDLKNRPIPSHEIAMEANLRRLGSENCDYRYRTASLASELHKTRITNMALYGAQDFEDDSSPLIYADQSIDPNDEQSLVNWFGWWTTMRSDQFKKFHVLGSSPDMTITQRKTGEHRIRLPKYTRGTLNDPDALLKAAQKKEMESEQSVGALRGEPPHQQASGGVVVPSRNGPNQFAFPSNLISSEREIHSLLEHLNVTHRFPTRNTLWQLNIFPVAWIDLQMSDHFGDYDHQFSRVSEWFMFPNAFAEPPFVMFNTYIGFFYTITDDWDPKTTPQPSAHCRPQRHPWLLFYRPVNPHLNPAFGNKDYDMCEIIIWDPSAHERVPGFQDPTENDLLDMQRRTIQYIRDNTHRKNPGSWIENVWLGGHEPPGAYDSPHAFDRTVAFLKYALQDLKNSIPAPPRALRNNGFRKVDITQTFGSRRKSSESPNGSTAMDIDDDAQAQEECEEDSEDVRIIFHPPRATRLPPGQRSQCANRLYEEVRLARIHAPHREDIRYSFVPTEEWYNEQKKEGRAFEHINVQSWENIFNIFKIGTSKTIVGSAMADDESGGSPASA